MKEKKCCTCKITKPLVDYHNRKDTNDGKSNKCKECANLYALSYRQNPKNQLKNIEYLKKYRSIPKNREKAIQYCKKYNLPYIKKRAKEDNNFNIRINLRQQIYRTIKNNISSNSFIEEIIGCTIEECRNHLQSKFTNGMNWDTCGKYGWHIDHIQPLSSFNLTIEEEKKRAFHYTNIQPLWWYDNINKGIKVS